MGFLLRVRGDHWAIEVSNWINNMTTSLATGSALSPLRFSELFGSKGWPGHVTSAADVVHFLMDDPLGTGAVGESMNEADIWLDSAGMGVWMDWQIDDGDGSLVSCVSEPAANAYFSRGHWECIWQSEIATYVISINKVLTTATMAIQH